MKTTSPDSKPAAPPDKPPAVYKRPGIKPVWCPGCGDYGVLTGVLKCLSGLAVPPEDLVFVSGIGCSGRFSHYLNVYAFHGTHGRT
ncbi:MAG: 2-oxoacid:ferredoxin oxidoreductase subunit beta, partial [Spirochaetales bacterium]